MSLKDAEDYAGEILQAPNPNRVFATSVINSPKSQKTSPKIRANQGLLLVCKQIEQMCQDSDKLHAILSDALERRERHVLVESGLPLPLQVHVFVCKTITC